MAAVVALAAPARAADHCGVVSVEVPGQTLGAGADVSEAYRRVKVAKDHAVAKVAAIRAWSAKVHAECPGDSAIWPLASQRKLDICDQAMGGRFSACASAEPHRKH